MKLIVISPEAEDAREHAVLVELFVAGLTSYHLRKPTWTRERMAAWLGVVPAEFHARIVLHTHHDLAGEFVVGGVHEREAGRAGPPMLDVGLALAPSRIEPVPEERRGASGGPTLRSRAIHDLSSLRTSLDGYDRLLVSPIFPSFSKPGHGPTNRLPADEVRAVLALPRRAEAIALGGIDASRIAACRELGFDGVAVLGAIWQASDPVPVFNELQNALHAHAA